MINVDISNVWGQLALPDLLEMEKEVAEAHRRLCAEETGCPDWPELPGIGDLERIRLAAEAVREQSEVCVVVGPGEVCQGIRGVMELLQGADRNLGRGKGDPVILFAGEDLSPRRHGRLAEFLKGKEVSLIVISWPEAALEPAIAFRALKWMLERRYGTDEAKKRIRAVTEPGGALEQMAREGGWEQFSLPAGKAGLSRMLTAAGLLPLGAAGLDIGALAAGAAEAKDSYAVHSYDNPLWLYAAVRNLLYRGGKAIELLECPEPDFGAFGTWWQGLFARAEGKGGKGLLTVPGDPDGLGQRIREGARNLFETVVTFDPPENGYAIGGDWKNLDGLNDLEGVTLERVREQAWLAAAEAHVDAGVPVLTMECGRLTEGTLGGMLYFLELGCALSAGVMGVDPFARPGAGEYRQNLARLLGRVPEKS